MPGIQCRLLSLVYLILWGVKEYSVAEQMLAQTLARMLRARRKELGLTQEQVALAANIERNTYQLMESGLSDRTTNRLLNPRLFTLMALAQVLELPLAEVFTQAQAQYLQYKDRSAQQ